MIVSTNISSCGHTLKSSIESFHPRCSTVDNRNISPESDCAFWAFTIEMAVYIASASLKINGTTGSQSAFQMNRCNDAAHTTCQSSSSAKPFKTASEIQKGT